MPRRPSILSPFAFIRRMGLYRGLLGGQRGWLIAGGSLWAFKRLRGFFGRSESVVTTEVLKAGQFMSLETIRPLTRRQRRRARRA
jgi:hypothetical protein